MAWGELCMRLRFGPNACNEEVLMIAVDQTTLNDAAEVTTSANRILVQGPIIRDAAPCFTAGTLIVTMGGEKPVEDISVGDLILTADNGFQPVRWVGRRNVTQTDLALYPQLRPVIIRKGTFGNQRDLRVSPQHGMMNRIDGKETLVRAKNVNEVMGEQTAERDTACEQVTYYHIMFDQHELIFAEGALTEAFFPGPSAVGSLDCDARDELLLLFPELTDVWTCATPASDVFGHAARSYLVPASEQLGA